MTAVADLADDCWRRTTEWWTDPRLAYAAGLEDGYTLRDIDDDAAWRHALRRLFRTGERRTGDGRPLPGIVAQADARAAADRGERAG